MSDSRISVPRIPWHEEVCPGCRGVGDIWVRSKEGTRNLVYCPLCGSGGAVPASIAREVYYRTTGEPYEGPDHHSPDAVD